MAEKRSIFRSAARAFFGALFGVLGLFLGVIVIVIVFGLFAVAGGRETQAVGRHRVVPDANWSQTELTRHSPLLLYVNITGAIGSENLNPEWVRNQLVRSQVGGFEGRIHGVLLNINSPGGGAFATETIYHLVKEYKERFKVPVYAYTDGICASAAFYIACAADKIYASEVSLIGSVGVIASFFNIYDTLEKVGVKPLILTAGKAKDLLNPVRPWKEGDDEEFKTIIDHLYQQFIDVVDASRPALDKKKLVDDYGARVFPASIALKNGYIDGIVNTRSEVIGMLAKESGVDQQDYQVVELEERSWVDQLVRGEHPLLSGKMEHRLSIAGHDPLPTGYLYLYREA